jgi:hypothetical protein
MQSETILDCGKFIYKITPKVGKWRKTKMNNNRLMTEIMDLRDCRIRLQRRVAMLEDKALWEPKNFTEDDAYWLRYYKADIARIKAAEAELRERIVY